MRICLVAFEYPPETGWGGIGTQTRHKARGLSARGHDVQVISASYQGASVAQDQNATLHRIAAPLLDPLEYDGPAMWLSWSIAAAQKVRELEEQSPFDIVHFPEYGGEGFIYQTASFDHRSCRYTLQLHGPVTMFADQSGWPVPRGASYEMARFLERNVMHHSDLVMASSRNTANFCARKHDYPPGKIEVIYSGVNADRFSPQTPPRDERRPKILFVGKPSVSKGFPPLVEAVLALRKEFPLIVLRTVGRVTEDETIKNLKSRIAQAQAQSSFEFLPNAPHDDLPVHYQWCDLLAGPSIFEPGPGNVYLEAMSCGKAVVACNTGGTPESVLDRQTGLLVSPDSSTALRDAIAELASDERLRAQLGTAGRQWILERFSMDKYLDRVESFYQKLVDAGPPS
jgi:glycosyltransferase involved in cell wall biosynthesis